MRIIIQFLLLILLSASNIGYGQNKTTFLAGVSQRNITPQEPIRMSGYGNRTEPFSGVHDSIYCTAIVIQLQVQTGVLISADVVGLSHEFVDELRAEISERMQTPQEHIVIAAAHNHGGPVTSVYLDQPTEDEKTYFQFLADQMVFAAQEAKANLQPARIGAGKGRCNLNINRRATHSEGGIWLGRNPSGPCDQELSVIRFDDLEGHPIAAMINWPCHATVSGQENLEITGDWPGMLAAYFAQSTGVPAFVTAGASADINPIYGPNNRFRDIEAIAQALNGEAIKVFDQIKTYTPSTLRFLGETFMAKGKKRSESRMPNVSLQPAEDEEIRVSCMQMGHIILVGISGELMTEIGMDVKESSPFKHTVMVTHCNGSSGYLCTDQSYLEGGYEPMVSRTMPGTAAMIREIIQIMLNTL